MNVIESIERQQLKDAQPNFRPGDTLRIHVRIVEGDKERIQLFEGVCIRRSGGAIRETFTVRKTSYGVGVERTFPCTRPAIDRIDVTAKRQGPPREALLPARALRQSGAHRGRHLGPLTRRLVVRPASSAGRDATTPTPQLRPTRRRLPRSAARGLVERVRRRPTSDAAVGFDDRALGTMSSRASMRPKTRPAGLNLDACRLRASARAPRPQRSACAAQIVPCSEPPAAIDEKVVGAAPRRAAGPRCASAS